MNDDKYLINYLESLHLNSMLNDNVFNITKTNYNVKTTEYVLEIMKMYKMYEYEELILGLYYFKKMSKLCVIPYNILTIIFVCCMMLSGKFLIDTPYKNDSYSRLLNITLKTLNEYELEMLKLFDFNICVSNDELNTFEKNIFEDIINFNT